MSPRAAVRLRQLGFADVYDYAGGKSDWLAAGLPYEGARGDPTAGEVADRDVPSCPGRMPLRHAESLIRRSGRPYCVVVEDDVVLGLLRPTGGGADDRAVWEAMQPGPTTVRAAQPAAPLLERLRETPELVTPVTDPDGRLLGVVDAAAAESAQRPG